MRQTASSRSFPARQRTIQSFGSRTSGSRACLSTWSAPPGRGQGLRLGPRRVRRSAARRRPAPPPSPPPPRHPRRTPWPCFRSAPSRTSGPPPRHPAFGPSRPARMPQRSDGADAARRVCVRGAGVRRDGAGVRQASVRVGSGECSACCRRACMRCFISSAACSASAPSLSSKSASPSSSPSCRMDSNIQY